MICNTFNWTDKEKTLFILLLLTLVKSHLYPPVQQLNGQDFEGGAAFAGETGQPAEETRRAGVPDHVTRMEHVQRLKVVVDRVADDHFALKYTEDL